MLSARFSWPTLWLLWLEKRWLYLAPSCCTSSPVRNKCGTGRWRRPLTLETNWINFIHKTCVWSYSFVRHFSPHSSCFNSSGSHSRLRLRLRTKAYGSLNEHADFHCFSTRAIAAEIKWIQQQLFLCFGWQVYTVHVKLLFASRQVKFDSTQRFESIPELFKSTQNFVWKIKY